jgi:hypothetical protein
VHQRRISKHQTSIIRVKLFIMPLPFVNGTEVDSSRMRFARKCFSSVQLLHLDLYHDIQ